jgi:DNA-binding SARP family transcriptional activator
MLTVRLFGTPTFLLDNRSFSHLIAGRATALLAYLAVTRQQQPRTLLADLLWENIGEQQARTNLRYLLSNLRKVVGDYVVAQGESVAFNQDLPHWLDVTAFTTYMGAIGPSTAATIEPEILQELLNLYAGEFLAGFQAEGAPIFDRWMLTQRRHLHDLLVQGLRLRTQQHLDHGEYAEGLAINHYLLTLEPWREEAHRQRMLLLAYSDQRSAALQQYTRCCQALAQELDVPPMPQTTSLYEQIKSGQWFAAQSIPEHRQHLPVAITPFPVKAPSPGQNGNTHPARPNINSAAQRLDLGAMPDTPYFCGRQAELATLRSWAGQEQSRLIALLGCGGQGKTALAAAFVQEVIEDEQSLAHGFTQVIWRSLRSAPPCTEVLKGWLRQLEGEPKDAPSLLFDELVSRLFAHLQERRCLLILDGVDALISDSANAESGQTEAYRPGCEAYDTLFRLIFQRRHRSCLLLTSRVRPTVLSHLDERNGAFRNLELAGLTLADGSALLSARRIAGDPIVAQQLHRFYAGNPLLLTQAANLICELFGGSVATFLQEGLYFLGDIGAVLTQQLATLAPLEQQVLQRLAQAGQPIDRQSLYAKLTPAPAKRDYFRVLQRLQRTFLLQQNNNLVELPAQLMAYLTEHTLPAER